MFSQWFWAERRKKRRLKRARITQLENSIAEVWKRELRNAKTPEDQDVAYQVADAQTRYDQNELDSLRQEKLRGDAMKMGVVIPREYYENDEWPMKRTLSYEGEAWTRRELRKMWIADIKALTEIIVPILALLVALVSVLRK